MEIREGKEWGKSDWELKNPRLILDSSFLISILSLQNYKGKNAFVQEPADLLLT